MDISDRILDQQLEDAKSRIAYLKEIEIGIPPEEINELQKSMNEALASFRENKSFIAKNKLGRFNQLFTSVEERYFSSLTPRQIDSISRSDQRPTTLDYAREVFDDFEEFKGMDANSTDPAGKNRPNLS